ncbi:MAG: non-canonical purine NTP pyrophosphatase, partial [Ligilactobacillus agilis]|nr:non-canonical purine NTP pyrophosphatase [Ligilactobacillus agilis]
MKEFVIASNNQAKKAEIVRILAFYGAKGVAYDQLIGRIDFPKEGTTSYIENAKQKALALS